jgi:hypothetical protein
VDADDRSKNRREIRKIEAEFKVQGAGYRVRFWVPEFEVPEP